MIGDERRREAMGGEGDGDDSGEENRGGVAGRLCDRPACEEVGGVGGRDDVLFLIGTGALEADNGGVAGGGVSG